MGTIAKEKRQPLIDTIIAVCRQYNYKPGHLKGNKPSEFWPNVMAKLPTDEISWPDSISYFRNVWIDIQQDVMDALKADVNTSITTNKPQQSKQTSLLPSESPEPSDLDAKIDKRIEKKISDLLTASFLSDLPLPPPRKKEKVVMTKGKRKGFERMKEVRDYGKLSFSIDRRLFHRFTQEAAKRGINQSTLFEAILMKVFNVKLD